MWLGISAISSTRLSDIASTAPRQQVGRVPEQVDGRQAHIHVGLHDAKLAHQNTDFISFWVQTVSRTDSGLKLLRYFYGSYCHHDAAYACLLGCIQHGDLQSCPEQVRWQGGHAVGCNELNRLESERDRGGVLSLRNEFKQPQCDLPASR